MTSDINIKHRALWCSSSVKTNIALHLLYLDDHSNVKHSVKDSKNHVVISIAPSSSPCQAFCQAYRQRACHQRAYPRACPSCGNVHGVRDVRDDRDGCSCQIPPKKKMTSYLLLWWSPLLPQLWFLPPRWWSMEVPW